MTSRDAVRYERLRPAQIVARRQACPVAWVPIGTIEWHGEHNPVGLDTLKIHALLERCALEIGGLVLPPLYYGECREQALMEANAATESRLPSAWASKPATFAGAHVPIGGRPVHELPPLLLHICTRFAASAFAWP
jgi:creatinine amidohydrolase